jgi:hypothetical protein
MSQGDASNLRTRCVRYADGTRAPEECVELPVIDQSAGKSTLFPLKSTRKEKIVTGFTVSFKTVSAAALAIALLSSPCRAEGTLEQRRACRADAFKFCSSEIPNIQRITACMNRNIEKLSPACRAQFGGADRAHYGSS